MHSISLWTVYGVYAILFFVIVLTVIAAALLAVLSERLEALELWCRGESARAVDSAASEEPVTAEAAKVLAALVVMTDSVDSMREQNSAEHGALLTPSRDTNAMVRRILSRLGFLVATEPLQTDFAQGDPKRSAPPPPPPPPLPKTPSA